jgi:hypothetical protein
VQFLEVALRKQQHVQFLGLSQFQNFHAAASLPSFTTPPFLGVPSILSTATFHQKIPIVIPQESRILFSSVDINLRFQTNLHSSIFE